MSWTLTACQGCTAVYGSGNCTGCREYRGYPIGQSFPYNNTISPLPVKRVIEKFDKDGKLVERITEG